MALRTASASGDWSSTTTWGGSSVPGFGDNIVINASVTVTVTDAREIGTGPDGTDTSVWAVDMLTSASGGAAGDSYLTIANGGTLDLCGPSRIQNTASRTSNLRAIHVQNGGTLRYNARYAVDPTTATYRINMGNANANYRHIHVESGGTFTSYKTDHGSGVPANGYLANINNGTPVVFDNGSVVSYIGDSTNLAVHGPVASNSANRMVLNGWMNNCGGVRAGSANNSGTFSLDDLTMTSPALIASGFGAGLAVALTFGTATYTILRARVQGGLATTGNGANKTMGDCVWFGRLDMGGLTAPMIDAGGNVLYGPATGTLAKAWASTITESLHIAPRNENNPKFVEFDNSFTTTFVDPIFESFLVNSPAGEFFSINLTGPSVGAGHLVEGAIFNPYHDGYPSARLGECLASNPTTENWFVEFRHCSGTAAQFGAFGSGHNVGETNGVEKIRGINNLLISTCSVSQVWATAPLNYQRTDALLDIYWHHNAFGAATGKTAWQITGNAVTSAGTVPARTGNASYNGGLTPYFHLVTTPDLTLGTGDLHAYPFLSGAVPACKIDDWAQTLGVIVGVTRAAREDEVMAALLVQGLSSHPDYRAGVTRAAYATFCRARWVPDNPAFLNSSDVASPHTTRPTLTTIGAEQYVAAVGGGLPLLLRSRAGAMAA